MVSERARRSFTVGRETPTASGITWILAPAARSSEAIRSPSNAIRASCVVKFVTFAKRVRRSNSSAMQ